MKKSLKVSFGVAGLLAVVVAIQTLGTQGMPTAGSVSVTLPIASDSQLEKQTKGNSNPGSVASKGMVSSVAPSAKTGADVEPGSSIDPASTPAVAEKDPEQLLQEFVSSGDPQGIRRVFAERRKERARLVKAKLDGEPVDMEWSEDLARRFEFARNLLPEMVDLKLTQTDCRNTVCALHVTYGEADYDWYQPFLQQVGIVLGSDAWVHHDALPHGGVIYVARENQELPKLKQL